MKQPMTAAEFAEATGVSRETREKLEAFDALLLEESAKHNLVARGTLPERWTRHYLDSAQLDPLIPEGAKTLIDLGSGAGFPGLVLAAMGEGRGLHVTLVESTGKKAAFLAAAANAMRLGNVRVAPLRAETLKPPAPPDVIVARALAPLVKLLGYGHGLAGKSTLCLFLKGQDVEVELTEAAKSWHMNVKRLPSRTHAGATILAIRDIAPKKKAP